MIADERPLKDKIKNVLKKASFWNKTWGKSNDRRVEQDVGSDANNYMVSFGME